MLAIGLMTTMAALGQTKDSPEVMLGAGLHQEEVESNCKEAIRIYQEITQQKNAPRNVMARAQLHIGICEEKLAQSEARAAYQEVLGKYADQGEIVDEATRRLTALGAEPKSPQMPREYLGDWAGNIDETITDIHYRGSISLFGGGVGTVVGTFAYMAPYNCGGEWRLQSVTSNSIELIEKVTYGTGCADNGLVTLKLTNNAALDYRWHHELHRPVSTATFVKSGKPPDSRPASPPADSR